jgi:hypothetical protein
MKKYPLDRFINPVRKPVKREGAENYLLYTLLSFAASVTLTRLFLELTGYPQVGNSELHIAHVLWGGLLLFVASLLPLILANRWVYIVGALFAGIGVGLFIDEVGKFITQSNDYFYPAAAPIIYAFFLVTVLVYFQVRKPPVRDSRSELYRALDAIEEVLDHDLEESERSKLKARLKFVEENADHPDLVSLAEALSAFLASEAIHTTPDVPDFWMRWKNRLSAFEAQWISQGRLRAILAGGLLALGIVALAQLTEFLWRLRAPDQLEFMVSELVSSSQISSASGLGWFSARLILEGIVGLMLLVAAILLVVGKEQRGIQMSIIGLLLSLTTVNLLIFYFEQFSTIITATIQFLLLLGVIHYRKRYLNTSV